MENSDSMVSNCPRVCADKLCLGERAISEAISEKGRSLVSSFAGENLELYASDAALSLSLFLGSESMDRIAIPDTVK